MPPVSRLLALMAATAAGAAIVAGTFAGAAWATFSSGAPATPVIYSSAVLKAPTNLQVTVNCLNPFYTTATLTWTASTSKYISGYLQTYTVNGGSSQQGSTISATATSITFYIVPLITYTTALTSTYRSWSAASPSTSSFYCL